MMFLTFYLTIGGIFATAVPSADSPAEAQKCQQDSQQSIMESCGNDAMKKFTEVMPEIGKFVEAGTTSNMNGQVKKMCKTVSTVAACMMNVFKEKCGEEEFDNVRNQYTNGPAAVHVKQLASLGRECQELAGAFTGITGTAPCRKAAFGAAAYALLVVLVNMLL